jgi:hypothetical protein
MDRRRREVRTAYRILSMVGWMRAFTRGPSAVGRKVVRREKWKIARKVIR